MSETISETDALARICAICSYTDARLIGAGLYVAIARFNVTHGIIVGDLTDGLGYIDRWCYTSYDGAKRALDAWNGEREPAGWIRHPASGRRYSQSADERDQYGRSVGAVGVLYRRA